ncbi:hypothetical protein [Paraburkholderia rhynchosiae]|uniref:Lipoprotein n=1 Tax=Paraburkholderia rhynchosiae TaxID=487049 RepID=A0A2N7WW78_9BURK|nr:hypothetical protein [Paraburkholderia rhynchosiae]PMS33495.1 hypothetical protein C0Z16_02625 [Paraburkholderia rhynchosiae]CAB3681077.1 hypothetical protein LMG27174_02669 [Paraburkholderia rhynchosiae]
MKIRILTIACATTAAALLAACTAVYKNSDACEQMMRSKLAETSSDTLKIGHTGAGIDGSRVVVEGSIEHVMTASEVAAAAAAPRAGSGSKASVGTAASGVLAASALSASGVSAGSAAIGVTASGASNALAVERLAGASAGSGSSSNVGGLGASDAAASLMASEPRALALKPAKPKKIVQAAAAECTFHGPTLDVFSWLAPAKLAAPATQAASEADE